MANKFNKELFGERLTLLMREYGDTIYNLASFVHLTPSAISRYKNGGHVPRADVVESIAQRYNVNPMWLMGVSSERYIEVQDMKDIIQIPLLGIAGRNGFMFLDQEVKNYYAVEASEGVDYAMQVNGDDMIGARITDGDIIFVSRQARVENGEVAVVLRDEVPIIRRVFQFGAVTLLQPEHPKAEVEALRRIDGIPLKIAGKVVSVKGRVV